MQPDQRKSAAPNCNHQGKLGEARDKGPILV